MASGDAGASTAGRATSSTTATFGMATSAPRGTPAAPRGVPAAARVGRATGALITFTWMTSGCRFMLWSGCWFIDSSFRRCRGCAFLGAAPRRSTTSSPARILARLSGDAFRRLETTEAAPGDPAANARGRTDGSESAPDIAPVLSFPESFLNVRHRPRDRHVPAPEAREIRLAGAYALRADPFPVRAVGVATPPSSRAVGPFDNRGNAGDGNIPTALPRNARFRVPATKRPPPTPLPVPLVRAARTLPLTHRAPSPPVRERRRVHSPRSTRPR